MQDNFTKQPLRAPNVSEWVTIQTQTPSLPTPYSQTLFVTIPLNDDASINP